MKTKRPGLIVRCFQTLLKFYPSSLRQEFGDEMIDVVDQRWRELRARSGSNSRSNSGSSISFAWQILRDTLVSLPREHWRALTSQAAAPPITSRRTSGDTAMSTFLQDLRFAVRTLGQQPLVSFLIVGMLALGIAGNAVIFSVLDGLLLRPLPFDEPENLVYLDETAPKWGLEFVSVTYPDFYAWREQNQTFDAMGVTRNQSFNLATEEQPERVQGAKVSHDLPDVLRLRPVLGRFFTAEEDQPGGPDLVVLGHALWRQQFGGRTDVIDSVIHLNGQPYTVIGVLPAVGRFPNKVELWTSLRYDPTLRQSFDLKGVGRLRPGVSRQQALADLSTIQQRLIDAGETTTDAVSPVLAPLRDRYIQTMKPFALTLMGAVALVLLIACANVACLLLARATARGREMGIRAALGAGRWRLTRQMLTESLLLSMLGGLAGGALAYGGHRVLISLLGDRIPFWATPQLDARIFLFGAGVCLVTAFFFGLAPALLASREAVFGVLRAGHADAGRRRSLPLLIVTEIALALVLLVGASLLVQSFVALRNVDPGFRSDHVLTFSVALPSSQYDEGSSVRFFSDLRQRLSALPGVRSASAVSHPPLGGHSGYFFEAENPTRPPDPDEQNPVVLLRAALPGYFETMGVTLMRGRAITRHDMAIRVMEEGTPDGATPDGATPDGATPDDSARVIVVNETFAEHYWPGKDPIGQRVKVAGERNSWFTVVGVNRDVKHYGLDRPMRPGVHLPLAKIPQPTMAMVLHTEIDAGSLAEPVRALVAEMNAQLPLFGVTTMEEKLDQSLQTRNLASWLAGLFAVVALVLAAGGIYGVVSYSVGRRTREIGIRMALGARADQVRRLVLSQGTVLAMTGISLGVGAAFGLGRTMTDVLYGVSATDPWTLGGAASALVAIALLANLVPAARAARIAPMSALRDE